MIAKTDFIVWLMTEDNFGTAHERQIRLWKRTVDDFIAAGATWEVIPAIAQQRQQSPLQIAAWLFLAYEHGFDPGDVARRSKGKNDE